MIWEHCAFLNMWNAQCHWSLGAPQAPSPPGIFTPEGHSVLAPSSSTFCSAAQTWRLCSYASCVWTDALSQRTRTRAVAVRPRLARFLRNSEVKKSKNLRVVSPDYIWLALPVPSKCMSPWYLSCNSDILSALTALLSVTNEQPRVPSHQLIVGTVRALLDRLNSMSTTKRCQKHFTINTNLKWYVPSGANTTDINS